MIRCEARTHHRESGTLILCRPGFAQTHAPLHRRRRNGGRNHQNRNMAEPEITAATAEESQTGLTPIFQPVAPNHPIVISCINGGFAVPLNGELEQPENRQANFFIPPFAPVFTPRRPPEPTTLPLVVANTAFITDTDWKFLGIAFTSCTVDEALRLSMAPTKTSQNSRIAVIVGGSCTVAANSGWYSQTRLHNPRALNSYRRIADCHDAHQVLRRQSGHTASARYPATVPTEFSDHLEVRTSNETSSRRRGRRQCVLGCRRR